MSDVDRERAAKGTKLMTRHVFGAAAAPRKGLAGIGRDMEDSEVEPMNLETPRSFFKVHLTWPYVDSEIANFHAAETAELNLTDGPAGVCAPILVPPLQEFFGTDDAPTIVLEDIVYSFDQRSEGCVTASKYQDVQAGVNSDTDTGNMFFDQNQRLDVSIVIYSKTPIVDREKNLALYARYPAAAPQIAMQHENYQVLWLPEQVVFEASLSGVLIGGPGGARSNPHVIRNIGRRLDPQKSYMAALIYPNLGETGAIPRDDFAIVNVQLVLKFTHPLVKANWRNRIPSGVIPQNSPRINRARVGPTVQNVATPAPGSKIETEGTSGFNTFMTDLDRELRSKLLGGLGRNCMAPGFEALGVDSSYDVIMVPMFQNPFNGMIKNKAPSEGIRKIGVTDGYFFGAPTQMPYEDGDYDPVGSRRIIPLPFPFELHHAFACLNWQKAEKVSEDNSPGISHDIGVVIASGMVADHSEHDQVARLQFVQKWADVGANPISPSLVDRWAYPFHRAVEPDLGFDGTVLNHNVAWEIYQIPLVSNGGSGWGGGTSGPPVFMGQGMGASGGILPWPVEGNQRTDLDAGFARCAGGEQFIEVRWRMIADDPYNQGPATPGWTNLVADQTIVGYQGHYVILCGRRYLTDGR